MITPHPCTWLSVHLFYNEPWEEFLYKAVQTYANTAIQTGIAQQYFFIRYWEQGPHIRLRLKGEVELVETILKPNLHEHFSNYFEFNPSRRTEPSYPPNFPENLKWLPDNSIHYINYKPEVERYGGEEALLLSERQFMYSSKMALDFINKKGKNWSYDDSMGAAIQMHLSFAHAANFDVEETLHFFEFFFNNWLPHLLKKFHNQLTSEEYQHRTQMTIKAYERAFQSQRDVLYPFITLFCKALENESEFENMEMNEWILNNKELVTSMKKLQKREALIDRPSSLRYKSPPKTDPENEMLWNILADYIHMTNNRLGIRNNDEAFIAFLIMRSLEEMKKKSVTLTNYKNKIS